MIGEPLASCPLAHAHGRADSVPLRLDASRRARQPRPPDGFFDVPRVPVLWKPFTVERLQETMARVIARAT